MKKFLDFLEVGTSDFDALILSADDDDYGIAIDPVGFYLERLPELKNYKKINVGVSDRDGEVSVFYLHPDDIESHGLPDWLRGCNSIGSVHPTVKGVLEKNNIDIDLIRTDTVAVEKLSTILKREKVSGIYHLKVDTEGHDLVILNKFFDDVSPALFPHELQFESNSLSSASEISRLIARLVFLGYDIVKCETGGGATNTFMRLNIQRVGQSDGFTGEIAGYYLTGYPDGYSPSSIPHENTLESAMDYCRKIDKGGVTYQYGRYEVREGTYLKRAKRYPGIKSWLMMA